MISTRFGMCAIAVGMLFSAATVAEDMSKEKFKSGNERIAGEHKSAKDACKSHSGNARDICMKEADAGAAIAKADLKAEYQPSSNNRYQASVKKAQAEYAVAKERCDDKAGNAKDLCVKQAKAAEVAAKADAKAKMKISDATGTAVQKTSDARQDARSDKRDAEYVVAKEKCDVLAGDVKARCMSDAKTAFGKS